MTHRRPRLAGLCGLALLAPAPRVQTTFYPLTYFAQRIAGDAVELVCPVPASADAAFWRPDAATLRSYQEADLILVNGAGFEHWLDLVSLPWNRTVDTSRGFRDEYLHRAKAVEHVHGQEGRHSHVGLDGHTWLDPRNAIRQARAVGRALQRLLPERADELERRERPLVEDLEALDATLRELSARLGERTLLASHPAYDYLARSYGWHVESLAIDPEADLGPDALRAIQALAERTSARVLLWEAAPREDVVRRLEQLGLASVLFSPCEALTPEEARAGLDYLGVMHANLERLAGALDGPR